jgi:hypothetical protein
LVSPVLLAAAVNWTTVIVAGIAGLPAIIAAITAILIRRDTRTTNGRTLGSQVEEVHQLVTDAAPIVQKIISGDVEPPHGDPANGPRK